MPFAGRPRDHQVIENAAIGVKQLRIALLAGLQAQNIGRNQLFHRALRSSQNRGP